MINIRPVGSIYTTIDPDFNPNDFIMYFQVGNSSVSVVFDHTHTSLANVNLDTKITFEKLSSGTSRVDYRPTNNTLHFKLNANTLLDFANAFPTVGFLHVEVDLLSGTGLELIPFDAVRPLSRSFQGVWSEFGTGKTLVGAGIDPTLGTYNLGDSGGSKSHTLTTSQIPAHHHGETMTYTPGGDTDLGGGPFDDPEESELIMYLSSSNQNSYTSGSNVWKDLTHNDNDMSISNVALGGSGGLHFNNWNSSGSVTTKTNFNITYNPEDHHSLEMWLKFNPIKFRITTYTMNNNGFGCEKSDPSPPVRLKFKFSKTWDPTWHDFFTTASKGSIKFKDFTSFYQIPSEIAIRNDNNDGYGFWKISITVFEDLNSSTGIEHIIAEHPNGSTGETFASSRFWIDGNQDPGGQGAPKEVIFRLNGADPNRFSNPNTSGVESFSTNTPVISRWWLGTFGTDLNALGSGSETSTMHLLRGQFGLWGMGAQFDLNLARDGDWHHIVVQINSSNGSIQWYKDNSLLGTSTSITHLTNWPNKVLTINPGVATENSFGFKPNVDISTIRIWRDGLSSTNINYLYNLGELLQPDQDPLLVDFNLNRAVFMDSAGGGGAHNNVQPYTVIKMWKRDS